MAALDFNVDGQQVNRLTVVKRVFHDFVMGKGKLPGRPDDLIGLITFGGFVEPKCPLTLDHGALIQVLDAVEIPHPIFDSQGRVINERLWQEDSQTAIGDALAMAAKRLKDVQGQEQGHHSADRRRADGRRAASRWRARRSPRPWASRSIRSASAPTAW